MPNRVAHAVVVCEDIRHRQFVTGYLERLELDNRNTVYKLCDAGSGEQFVRELFPKELVAFRAALARRSAALVAVIDADLMTVEERMRQFPSLNENEPCVLVIPKRHIETWILALAFGEAVDESTDYHHDRRLSRESIRGAAERLWTYTRPGGSIPEHLPNSIHSVSPRLKRFEEALRSQWR